MYRSTDKVLMDNLKKTVLTVTEGDTKMDRKYALDYLRTHLRVDDLHRLAIKYFPRREIVFGTGTLLPKLVVLTSNPIQAPEREKLERAWGKLGIDVDDVYYAHLRFVPTKKKQEKRSEIVGKLLDILKPHVVLAFDEVDVETKAKIVDVGYPIKIVTHPKSKEETRDLTQKLKEIRGLIRI